VSFAFGTLPAKWHQFEDLSKVDKMSQTNGPRCAEIGGIALQKSNAT